MGAKLARLQKTQQLRRKRPCLTMFPTQTVLGLEEGPEGPVEVA